MFLLTTKKSFVNITLPNKSINLYCYHDVNGNYICTWKYKINFTVQRLVSEKTSMNGAISHYI